MIYTRSNWFIRSQNKICALKRIYALSERHMRVETNLYALSTIYARWNEFMRCQNDICAL